MNPEYKHLTPYVYPKHYYGASWYGYMDVAGRNRDSDTLTESNWACWLEFLTDLLGPADTVIGQEPKPVARTVFGDTMHDDIYNWTVCRESCSMVGWIEIIRVHESVGHEKLQKIDDQLHRLDGYPVFDEGHFSEAEQKEYEKCWRECGAANEFRRVVRKAFEAESNDPNLPAMLDRFDDLDVDTLIDLHERLIPSGEYHYDCWPRTDISVEAMTWDDLEEVTNEEAN